MNVEIRFPRFEFQFGRNIATGQLYNVKDGHLMLNGSISQILQHIKINELTLVNAQEILDLLIRQNGFAS